MPTTKAHFEAIGRVAYEWSRLEMLLQTAIAVIADIDQHKSLIITNAGSVRSWTEILSRLAEDQHCDAALCARTRKLGDKISEKLHPKRNMVVHGIWDASWEEIFGDRASPIPQMTSFLRVVRKSGKHMDMVGHLTAAHVMRIADAISDAREELIELTEALVASLPDRPLITFPRPPHRRNRQS